VEPVTAAVTSASEATDDVENDDDKTREATTKVEEKEKEKEPVQKSVIPEVLKNGNLYKQSQSLRIFELRYFVLTKDKLLQYQSSSEPSTQKTIDLSSDCKVKIPEGKHFHFLFDLEANKARTYRLYANTEDERKSWIEALQEYGVTFVQHEKEQSSSR
jgi:hypothetical protein